MTIQSKLPKQAAKKVTYTHTNLHNVKVSTQFSVAKSHQNTEKSHILTILGIHFMKRTEVHYM